MDNRRAKEGGHGFVTIQFFVDLCIKMHLFAALMIKVLLAAYALQI